MYNRAAWQCVAVQFLSHASIERAILRIALYLSAGIEVTEAIYIEQPSYRELLKQIAY